MSCMTLWFGFAGTQSSVVLGLCLMICFLRFFLKLDSFREALPDLSPAGFFLS